MIEKLPELYRNIGLQVLFVATFVLITALILGYSHISSLSFHLTRQKNEHVLLEKKIKQLEISKTQAIKSLSNLRSDDQFIINKKLKDEIASIQKTYKHAVKSYGSLVKLRESTKTDKLDSQFSKILTLLSDRNYASAEAQLITLDTAISIEQAKVAVTFAIPANVATNNTPPGSGYSRQKVVTPVGEYLVDIIAADLGSTRVIVDTASDSTCPNDCPVDALGSFAARSGAFAGINGPYFCPASYPSCAGKTNAFDTLIMNKNKAYFNSDNNIYSTVPAVIFSGNSARFVPQSLQWGRDTGVDSVIASQPMLTSGGRRVFGGDGEPKREGKGSRSFIGATGSTAYIGVVHNASVAEVAHVLEKLGIASALNLDSGGSTALWSGGRYLVGPGRSLPLGILFVRK